MRIGVALCLALLCVLPIATPAGAGESDEIPSRWELLNPPPGRSMHSAVWDPMSDRMLVFGGLGGGNMDDLWAFEPGSGSWEQLFPEGPRPARLIAHSAVWDTLHNQMLIFGGFGGGGSGLWSYDPVQNRWAAISPEGPQPGPRGYHSAVWDSERGRMYVFGGVGPNVEIYDDLWVYDSEDNTWTELPRPRGRPLRRFFHGAAWDPVNHEMLLFGGADFLLGTMSNDLWSYRPATNDWVDLSASGRKPSERLSLSALWDTHGSRLLVYGGGCGPGCYNDDLWSYAPATRTWQQIAGNGNQPKARGGQSGVWDPVREQMLLFGGFRTDGPSNEVWTFTPGNDVWSELPTFASSAPLDPSQARQDMAFGGMPLPFPAVRQGERGVWDAASSSLLMFGGFSGEEDFFDELWSYAPDSQQWSPIVPGSDGPSPRSDHAAAWDPEARALYVFGGYGLEGYSDELWQYDAETQEWTLDQSESEPPLGREDHSLVWDPDGKRLLVFGGTRGEGGFDDLWSYTPDRDEWTPLGEADAGPGPRYRHSAVWDTAHGRMLVFGGYGGPEVGSYLDDLWSYDPSTGQWEQLARSGPRPSPRAWHQAVWDDLRGRLIVIGGFAGGIDYLGDAWEYDPEDDSWTELESADPVPTARAQHIAVWADDRVLMYGGNRTSEVWQFWPDVP
jgi:N-acetylneuraminic acid mutarotase